MREYFVAAGPNASAPEAYAPYRSAGTSEGEVLLGGLSLKDGDVLVSLRAINNAKEASEVQLTISVDTNPPVCSAVAVFGRTGAAMQYINQTHVIEASWECADAAPWEDMPLICTWAIGTFPGGDDHMPWSSAQSSGTHRLEDAGLVSGVKYYTSVSCMDRVRMRTSKTSAGLMPDGAPPRIMQPLVILSPLTGRQLTYLPALTELYAAWGFRDFESGLASVRLGLTQTAEVPPATALPVEIPLERAIGDGARGFILRDDVQDTGGQLEDTLGIALQTNVRYYLHGCTTDQLGRAACTSASFLADLTPPVCETPTDVLQGADAISTMFTETSVYVGRFACADADSGIVELLFTVYAVAAGETEPVAIAPEVSRKGAGGGYYTAPIVLEHGTRYSSCIRARNGAGVLTVDTLCTGGVTFDGTAPRRTSGAVRDLSGALFVLPTSELCGSFGTFAEDLSEIAQLRWQLVHLLDSSSSVALSTTFQAPAELVVEDVAYNASVALTGPEVCRSLAEPLMHRGHYFSRVVVWNTAQPPQSVEMRSFGFQVDATPPDVLANATIRVRFPPDLQAQSQGAGNVSGISVQVVFARIFAELDSALASYTVRLSADGVVLAGGTLPLSATQFKVTLATALSAGTLLEAAVTATNVVGVSSMATAVHLLDFGILQLEEPWVSDAFGTGQRLAVPVMTSLSDFSISFQEAKDPLGADLIYSWSIGEAPCMANGTHVEAANMQPQGTVAAELFSRKIRFGMPFSGHAAYSGAPALASATGDTRPVVVAKSLSANLQERLSYCGVLTVCSLPTVDVPRRCVSDVTDLVTVDASAPEADVSMVQMRNVTSDAVVPLAIDIACTDLSGLASGVVAHLSIGTVRDPVRFLSKLKLELNLTSGLNLRDGNDVDEMWTNIWLSPNQTHLYASLKLDKLDLAANITDGTLLRASLVCFDRAGLNSPIGVSQLVMYDAAPPFMRRAQVSVRVGPGTRLGTG